MLYIKTFFASIAIHIVQNVFFSALLWGAKWVFSLLSIGETPGWKEFIWGSAGIFLLQIPANITFAGISYFRLSLRYIFTIDTLFKIQPFCLQFDFYNFHFLAI